MLCRTVASHDRCMTFTRDSAASPRAATTLTRTVHSARSESCIDERPRPEREDEQRAQRTVLAMKAAFVPGGSMVRSLWTMWPKVPRPRCSVRSIDSTWSVYVQRRCSDVTSSERSGGEPRIEWGHDKSTSLSRDRDLIAEYTLNLCEKRIS